MAKVEICGAKLDPRQRPASVKEIVATPDGEISLTLAIDDGELERITITLGARAQVKLCQILEVDPAG